MKINLLPTVGLISIVFILAIAGNADFEDEARELLNYCAKVEAKIWPDYRQIFDAECTSERMEETAKLLK